MSDELFLNRYMKKYFHMLSYYEWFIYKSEDIVIEVFHNRTINRSENQINNRYSVTMNVFALKK